MKMPKRTARQFFGAFEQLARKDQQGLDIARLNGREGYRLQIGGFRAIYTIERNQLLILVLDAGSRGDTYK
jgi:mRNA interferase RelE/StbE|tara:strand:+ start:612 stop:824 length:213 start_codon:yes stop_codon:yes gene_type:complete